MTFTHRPRRPAAVAVLVAASVVAGGALAPLPPAQAQEVGDPIECYVCTTYPPEYTVPYGDPSRRGGGLGIILDPPVDPEPQLLPAPRIPGPGEPGYDPTAPPPPPTCVQVAPRPPRPSWAWALLPSTGTVSADPAGRGLTGLESRFWWAGQTTATWTQRGTAGVAADCSIIPAPVASFSARVVELRWDLGETTATSTVAGTADSPAVRHVYNDKSPNYVISVDAVWAGDPPGTVTTPAGTRPHPVVEIRAVLTG